MNEIRIRALARETGKKVYLDAVNQIDIDNFIEAALRQVATEQREIDAKIVEGAPYRTDVDVDICIQIATAIRKGEK